MELFGCWFRMFGDDLLTWFGNVLNFIILIYLILASFLSGLFDFIQSLIAAFGLLVSVLIHLYISLRKF